MCRTYNKIGSLSILKSELERNNIHEFKSLKDVINFQDSYQKYKQQLIIHHEDLIEKEKFSLNRELNLLDAEISYKRKQSEQKLQVETENLKQILKNYEVFKPLNIFQKLIRQLYIWNLERQIKNSINNFEKETQRSLKNLIDFQQVKKKRYEFITLQFSEAVRESYHSSVSELERKKGIIDNLNSFIYGALGEEKVVKTLEALSDEFILINDFSVSFPSSIYYNQKKEYIKSVQIDHILVAPSGIFLIETKNWNEKSLKNKSLRSPIEQIMRTSFVLFKLLNNQINDFRLDLDEHHWGNKKIPIKNVIVLMNIKPQEEFQHVKIVTLNELIGYINYFRPKLSKVETQKIAEYILMLNKQKKIDL